MESYNFTVRVTDANNTTSTLNDTISVDTPPIFISADGGTSLADALTPFQQASSPYSGSTGSTSSNWSEFEGNPAPSYLISGHLRARIPNHKYIRFDIKPGIYSGDRYGHSITFLSAGTGSPNGGGPSLRLRRRGGGWQYGYRTTTHGPPDTFVSVGSLSTPTDDNWHTIEIYILNDNLVDVDVDGLRVISGWDVTAYANGDWIWWDNEMAYSIRTYFDNIYASDKLP